MPARWDLADELPRLERRLQLQGLDGLKDLPPIAKSHPLATAPEVVARIEQLALLHCRDLQYSTR